MGKVAIGAESRLQLNYVKYKTYELNAEDDYMASIKEATKKVVEIAGNNKEFDGM